MKSEKEFTKEFLQIYKRHLVKEVVKDTPQIIEEIMQEKAKKEMEGLDVEDFLIDEINQNRKNSFSKNETKKFNLKKEPINKENFKSEYKKFFIEFPKIIETNKNDENFRDFFYTNSYRTEISLDKSKFSKEQYSEDKIAKFNSKLKKIEEIIKNSPVLKKNAKSLINNIYSNRDFNKSTNKINSSSIINKTATFSDILQTQISTLANTDDNLSSHKICNPLKKRDMIRQLNNLTNDKKINHLMNVIERQYKIKSVLNKLNHYEKSMVDSMENSLKVINFYETKSDEIKKKYKVIVDRDIPELF